MLFIAASLFVGGYSEPRSATRRGTSQTQTSEAPPGGLSALQALEADGEQDGRSGSRSPALEGSWVPRGSAAERLRMSPTPGYRNRGNAITRPVAGGRALRRNWYRAGERRPWIRALALGSREDTVPGLLTGTSKKQYISA